MSRLIGLDWGTSCLRAYRISDDGTVLEVRNSEQGIMHVQHGAFETILHRTIGDWLFRESIVIASGMIGSRQGWKEVPYIPMPCSPQDIADAMERVHGAEIPTYIVPGLVYGLKSSLPDVMRGEETQVLGSSHHTSGVFLLPGSHSKWVQMDSGRFLRHRTYLTGELFSALREHTILGRLMTSDEEHPMIFEQGVHTGLRVSTETGGLLHQLFGVRTMGLFDRIPPEALSDYLSGLLIGAELKDARRTFIADAQPVHIIANPALTKRYAHALRIIKVEAVSADTAARGHYTLAQLRDLI
jgi:2-dehydro-3-deoxygalactonokinase